MSFWNSETFAKLTNTVLGIGGIAGASTSNWGSLNNDLIAEFHQVDVNNVATGLAFKAVIKEGSIEQSFNWQSPFDNFNLESRYLGAMGTMQSGLASELLGVVGINPNDSNEVVGSKLKEMTEIPAGKSSITKMNSRQVYTGHQPLKISCTLLFRAWQDPQSEVIAPFNALLKMAYPAHMAENIADAVKNGAENAQNEEQGLSKVFPSDAPNRVIMTYKGETYPPLIIESIGKPLDAPYSPMGDLWLEIPVAFSTYQSMDYQDFANAQSAGINGVIGGLVDKTMNKISKLF